MNSIFPDLHLFREVTCNASLSKEPTGKIENVEVKLKIILITSDFALRMDDDSETRITAKHFLHFPKC